MSNQSLDRLSNGQGAVDAAKDGRVEEPQTTVIDHAVVFEYSGETDLLHVSELILRSQNISGFSIDTAKQLENLELLSLSHNSVSSLKTFTNLTSLVELNLNFNNICSLQGLKLPLLEKLFLSNNKIVTIQKLSRAMPGLKELCLYKNCINDLESVVADLKPFGKLEKLDLDGNPCSFEPEYRHAIVTKLRKLKQLDGERIQSLDMELAMSYYANKRSKGSHLERPSTAPAHRSDNSLLNLDLPQEMDNALRSTPLSHIGSDGNNGSMTSREATFHKLQKKLPKKPKKLFRSEFLNNHPIMMEYLAAGVVNRDQRNEEEVAAEKRAEAERKKELEKQATQKASRRKRGSFVDRLRGKFNLMNIQVTDENKVIIEDGNYIRAKEVAEEEISTSSAVDEDKPTRDHSYDALANSISLADPSDPNVMIRKLFEIVEMQENEIEQLKKSNESRITGDGENIDEIMQEVQVLRVENANMYMIKNENGRLRKQVKLLESELKSADATKGKSIAANILEEVDSGLTTKSESLGAYTTQLWEENQRLKKELAAALRNVNKSNSSVADNLGKTDENNDKAMVASESRRGLNGFFELNEEDLEIDDIETDDYLDDAEVEKLIEKNAKALKQIRHDADLMKSIFLNDEKSGSGK